MNLSKLLKRRSRFYTFLALCLVIGCADILGLFLHPFEVDFHSNFSYPLDISNLREIIEEIKSGQNVESHPSFINQYDMRFLIVNEEKCRNKKTKEFDPIVLLIVVKSALENFARRNAIRQTWGFEQRFFDVEIRTIFMLGSCSSRNQINCQDEIDEESQRHGDLVQADFEDAYYNNTLKVMTAFKWTTTRCPNTQFILFVDDDYYVSVKNLLKYARRPIDVGSQNPDSNLDARFDGRLYSGFVFNSSTPMRLKTSKWFVSISDYPYSHYPPYVTAGAILLTNTSLVDLYYASLYTKHFKFDDIYIGILAKKVSILPIHNSNFHFWKPSYSSDSFENVIASHGFGDIKELKLAWNQQKSLGNA